MLVAAWTLALIRFGVGVSRFSDFYLVGTCAWRYGTERASAIRGRAEGVAALRAACSWSAWIVLYAARRTEMIGRCVPGTWSMSTARGAP